QTIKECFETLTGHAASTQVGDEVKAMVATTNTGKPDLSTISNSTLRDFLSLFTAEFGTSAVSQKNGAFTVDYNVPVNVLHAGDVVKLQGIFAKPELDSGLKTALGTNAAAISTLDSFDEGDDITASATYSPQTARFGRQLAMNSNVFDALAWGRIAPFPQRDAPHEDGLVLLARAADKLAGAPEDVKKSHAKFSSMGDKAPEALAAFEAAILAMMADRQAEKALLTSFAELVNNQEQIYFSATYHDRNSLAGANAFSIKGTWEMGGKNLSKFLAQNRADCDLRDLDNEVHALEKPAPKSQACFTRFEEYVKSADRGLRFAFALDVQRTEANAIVLPQYSVNLSTERADTQIISASVGKRLDPPTSSHERRIDFTGSYENVDKDPNRDDRLVASVTYTQELTNTFSLPITLTFANKEKFLTAKDGNRVSAHFAISYKLPKM
ncbi:MAG TPA: hypothetical protein VGR02_22695, partial [Thermoanaerobaculia bacterium]|nr:hypothetical protein [Thermoanaerobaculia bacterium]